MRIPELNCDFAEGFGPYDFGNDDGLAPHVEVMNLACGVAGGDPGRIAHAVDLARRFGIKVGAHPSLPDREGFGRREMHLGRDGLRDALIWQIGAVKGFLNIAGLPLNHIKPHGLLNGWAGRDRDIAEALCDAAEPFGLGLFGQAGSELEAAARARGLPYHAEFFIDINYDDQGRMAADKTKPVDPDWVAARLKRAVREGVLVSRTGKEIPFRFDVACVHTDMPNPVEVAMAARRVLAELRGA